MKFAKVHQLFAAALLLATSNANAGLINWTDWQNHISNVSPSNSNSLVTGQVNTGSGLISIESVNNNPNSFVHLGGNTPNYWGPSGRTPTVTAFTVNGVDEAPVTSDMIALNAGGTVTINFGQQVTDAYIGLISWNGQSFSPATFNKEIELVSSGAGYWGSGSGILTSDNMGFTSVGEYHGIIKVLGTYTSFSFTHRSENWHGFSVGLGPQSTSSVSAPSAFALFSAVMAFVLFRRKVAKR